MRIRIKLTNNRYLYVSLFFICINLYIAIFNLIISTTEKVILVGLSVILAYFAYELKKSIDERGEGETFTLSKGQRFFVNGVFCTSPQKGSIQRGVG